MKKTVLTFGLISGAVAALLIFSTMPFVYRIGFDKGLIVGYTAIVVSLLLVPAGIRSYRENVGGGNITFGRAFAVGILITVISCIGYVLAWEIVYYNFLPDFADKYAVYMVEKAKASGATQQVIDATLQEMKGMKAMLDNPLILAAIGFTAALSRWLDHYHALGGGTEKETTRQGSRGSSHTGPQFVVCGTTGLLKKGRELRTLAAARSLIRQHTTQEDIMELGNFSISLAVKDIEASKLFYEKLGFTVFGGEQSQNWLIMKNGDHNIGLFQGMFEQNILTFNPGWDSDAGALSEFTDVRELQRQLKASGVTMIAEADETSTGPASFMIVDPDGNTILVDQHV